MALLNDDDAAVRALALHVLPDMFPPITRPLIETIDGLLADDGSDVQLQAAIALLKFKQPDRAWPTLDRLLHDPQALPRARDHRSAGRSHAPTSIWLRSCRRCTIQRHRPAGGLSRSGTNSRLSRPFSRWSIA